MNHELLGTYGLLLGLTDLLIVDVVGLQSLVRVNDALTLLLLIVVQILLRFISQNFFLTFLIPQRLGGWRLLGLANVGVFVQIGNSGAGRAVSLAQWSDKLQAALRSSLGLADVVVFAQHLGQAD